MLQGLTGQQLGELFNPKLSQSKISQIERGRCQITLGQALQIVAFTGGVVSVFDCEEQNIKARANCKVR